MAAGILFFTLTIGLTLFFKIGLQAAQTASVYGFFSAFMLSLGFFSTPVYAFGACFTKLEEVRSSSLLQLQPTAADDADDHHGQQQGAVICTTSAGEPGAAIDQSADYVLVEHVLTRIQRRRRREQQEAGRELPFQSPFSSKRSWLIRFLGRFFCLMSWPVDEYFGHGQALNVRSSDTELRERLLTVEEGVTLNN